MAVMRYNAMWLVLWAVRALSISTADDTLGNLYSFNFTRDQSIVVQTKLATGCMATFPTSFLPGSGLGQVALVKNYDPSYKTCWSPPYAHDMFPLQNGTVFGTDGSLLEAYIVSPPLAPATQWAQSGESLYYKAAKNGNVSIYTFDGTSFKFLSTVVGNSTAYVKVVDITATKTNTTYVFAPSTQLISSFPQLGPKVEGAVMSSSSNPVFRFTLRRFMVGGRPYVPEVDFNKGSGCQDRQKQYFPVGRADGREGVVHQDQSSKAVFMVWFGLDLKSVKTVLLLNTSDALAGAVSNGQSEIVILTANLTSNPDKVTQAPITAYKFHSRTGVQLMSVALPTDSSANTMNNYAYQSYGASMVWNVEKGTIGFIYAHLNPSTSGPTGLNHQMSNAVVMNATSLLLNKTWRVVSSHSFGHTTILDSVGNFLSMELGDNYPRGIKMSNFNASWITGRTVYSYKTYHMTSPGTNNYSVYTEISGPNKTFYKWSNDNNVYTELAHPGLFEASDGYLAFFAGERPSLDNSKCSGSSFNMARNIGYVKVPKDLKNQTWLTSWGTKESGGFYSYGGTWVSLTNNGTVWLTNYTDPLNSVSRLHALKMNSTAILLLWELWGSATGSYNKTQFMVVDWDGQVLVPVTNLNATMQLGRGEEPILKNGRLVTYSGSTGGQIVRYELCLFACSPAAPSPSTTTTGVPTVTTTVLV